MSRYFTVAPMSELGSNLQRAVRQLATTPRPMIAKARGYLLHRGSRYQRLEASVDRDAAISAARQCSARVGEAVVMVEGRVVYREIPQPVEKRIDPLTPKGFDKLVSRVARALRGVTVETEAASIARAIDRLDVDWPNLSARGRAAVMRAANAALADIPSIVLPGISDVFSLESERVIAGTRGALRTRFDFAIGTDLTRVDERIAEFVAGSQVNFVRDEYGRRTDELSALARQVASEGVAQGLGRDAISANLASALQDRVQGRNAFYWDVVASAFVNRARSFAEVAAFEEAGIEQYEISAVVDEVTTDICRFLDGRVLSVARAMDLFRQGEALRDPEEIRIAQPWLKVKQDERGNRALVIPGAEGDILAAIVTESAEQAGRRDDRGTFRRSISSRKLMDAGVGPPPYHGLCRSTLLPVIA